MFIRELFEEIKMEIRVIRSSKRKKTVSARLLNWNTLEVRVPARMSESDVRRVVKRLSDRMMAKRAQQRDFSSDEGLEQRAQALNRRYFGGQLSWRSIRWCC